MMLKFRTNADDYSSDDAAQFGISFPLDEGMTQPEFLADCDINNIVNRYAAVAAPLPLSDISNFMDFSNVTDFQTAMQSVTAIEGYFDSLPATIRKRFANNPSELLRFLDEPNNRSEAEILGLVKPSSAPVSQTDSVAVAGEGSGKGNALPVGGSGTEPPLNISST